MKWPLNVCVLGYWLIGWFLALKLVRFNAQVRRHYSGSLWWIFIIFLNNNLIMKEFLTPKCKKGWKTKPNQSGWFTDHKNIFVLTWEQCCPHCCRTIVTSYGILRYQLSDELMNFIAYCIRNSSVAFIFKSLSYISESAHSAFKFVVI